MARSVDLVVNPANPDEYYILRDNGLIRAGGGAPLPNPNPIVIGLAYGDRAVWMQPIYWGDVDPVTGKKIPNTGAGYVGTALGQVYAYGAATQPATFPVLAAGGAALYSCIGGIMDPAGNGAGWVVTHHGRLFKVLGPGGLSPTNMLSPTPNNSGAYDLIRAAHFRWTTLPEVVLVNGRGTFYRHANFGAVPVPTLPYTRTLDIIRGLEWNWVQDYGYMIDGYGQIISVDGAPAITSNRRFTTDMMTEMVMLDWGLTGSAASYRTLSSDGVTSDGIQGRAPRAYIVAPVGTNEQQRLQITGSPTGGTFRVAWNGETIPPVTFSAIPWNVTADGLADALAQALGIEVGDVIVEETAARRFDITFTRRFTSENVPQFSLQTNSLTGGTSPTVVPSTLVTGAPAIVTDTVHPEIRWVYGDAEGDVQAGVQIQVYPRAVTLGPPSIVSTPPNQRGIVEGGGTNKRKGSGVEPFWVTLIAGENVRAATIDKRLPNGQYRVYIQAAERNGNAGPWDYFDFDVNVTVPVAPTYLTTSDPATNAITLDLGAGLAGDWLVGVRRRLVNSYANDEASWTTVRALTPASKVLLADTFTRTDSGALGSAPEISALGTVAWEYEDATGATMPIVGGRAGGSAYAGAAYLPDQGVEIDSIGYSDVTFGAATSAHHVTAHMRYRSPSICAISVRSYGQGATEVRKTVNGTTTVVGTFVGALGAGASILVAGTTVTLTVDGVVRGTYTVAELAVDGALGIDGGAVGISTVGTDTRIGAFEAAQSLVVVVDHEVTPGESYVYEAWYQSPDGSIEGDHTASLPIVAPVNGWRLKDPLDPDLNMVLHMENEDLTIGNTEDQGDHTVQDSPYPVIISGEESADRFPLVVTVPDEVTLDALNALRRPARTLFLQSRTGRSWYVRLGPERPLTEVQADAAYGERLRTLGLDIIEVEPEPA